MATSTALVQAVYGPYGDVAAVLGRGSDGVDALISLLNQERGRDAA